MQKVGGTVKIPLWSAVSFESICANKESTLFKLNADTGEDVPALSIVLVIERLPIF